MKSKTWRHYLIAPVVISAFLLGGQVQANEVNEPVQTGENVSSQMKQSNEVVAEQKETADLSQSSEQTTLKTDENLETSITSEHSENQLAKTSQEHQKSIPSTQDDNNSSIETVQDETIQDEAVSFKSKSNNDDLAVEPQAVSVQEPKLKAEDVEAIYRLYNPNSGEHHYTSSRGENNHLISVGWKAEGIGWYAPKQGEAVHRLYNPNNGDHHYTKSKYESDFLNNIGWRYEGIGWYSGGKKAVYRLYNPNNKGAGSHHYTHSIDENNHLDNIGWNAEGIGWYSIDEANLDSSLVKAKHTVKATATPTGLELSVSSNTVTDYSKIQFAVWSSGSNKSDLKWYRSNVDGSIKVSYLNHDGFGRYNIEAYLDHSNKKQYLSSTTVEVASQKINTKLTKIDSATYSVVVDNVPAAISGVVVPVWSAHNDKDDIKWYEAEKLANGSYKAVISLANHNLDEGLYNVHVYGKGFAKLVGLGVTEGFVATSVPNQTGKVVISDVNKSNYTFTTTISEVGHKAGVQTVEVAVWSDSNGRDDLEWYQAFKQNDGTYKATIHLATHEYVNGTYQVHVHYGLKNKQKSALAALTTNITTPAPREYIKKELESIRAQFQHLFGSVPGSKSLVVMPTDGTELLSINDNVQRSASTIKLFIMAAAFAKAERGELNLQQAYTVKPSDLVAASTVLTGTAGRTFTLDDITRMMVQYSDNTATNIMISAVGGTSAVNNEIRRLGYTKTTLNRYMRIQSQIDAGLENYISAVEATDLLKNIYNSATTINPNSDRSMLAKLSNNYYKLWFPAGIQSMAQTWDKPGNDPAFGVENDIAIIKRHNRAYAIGLLTQANGGNGLSHTNRFAQLGQFIANKL
ncbi:GBS Bsp-like repeat-containing protein [Streptococcus phocae subsp. phocae]